MWSLSKFSDRLLENAKAAQEKALAAAEVAQSVLKAAAEEDSPTAERTHPESLAQPSPDTNFDDWNPSQPRYLDNHPSSASPSISSNAPLAAASFPPDAPPPPPPPPDSETTLTPPPPPSSLPPRTINTSRPRSSRYVVTAVKSTPASVDSVALIPPPILPVVPPLSSLFTPTDEQPQPSPINQQPFPEPKRLDQSSSCAVSKPSLHPDEGKTADDESNAWEFADEDWAVQRDTTTKESDFPPPPPGAPAPLSDSNPIDEAPSSHHDVATPHATADVFDGVPENCGSAFLHPPQPPSSVFESETDIHHPDSTTHNMLTNEQLPAPWDVVSDTLGNSLPRDVEQTKDKADVEDQPQIYPTLPADAIYESDPQIGSEFLDTLDLRKIEPKIEVFDTLQVDPRAEQRLAEENSYSADAITETSHEKTEVTNIENESTNDADTLERLSSSLLQDTGIQDEVKLESRQAVSCPDVIQKLDSDSMQGSAFETNDEINSEAVVKKKMEQLQLKELGQNEESEPVLPSKSEIEPDAQASSAEYQNSPAIADAFGFEIRPDPVPSPELEYDSWPVGMDDPSCDASENPSNADFPVCSVQTSFEDKSTPAPLTVEIAQHPTENGSTSETSEVKEAGTALDADSKPSLSGVLSDDVDWFSEDAAHSQTEGPQFSSEFQIQPTDTDNKESAPKSTPIIEDSAFGTSDTYAEKPADAKETAVQDDSVWDIPESPAEEPLTESNPIGDDDSMWDVSETPADPTEEPPSEPNPTGYDLVWGTTEDDLGAELNQESLTDNTAEEPVVEPKNEKDVQKDDVEEPVLLENRNVNESAPPFPTDNEASVEVSRRTLFTESKTSKFEQYSETNGLHGNVSDDPRGDHSQQNYEPESSSLSADRVYPDYENVAAQLEATKADLGLKMEEMQALYDDRNSSMARAQESEKEAEDLRDVVEQLRHQLISRDEEYNNLSTQANGLAQERDMVLQEKMMAERDRDTAAERGGAGVREARNVIENLQNECSTMNVRISTITHVSDELRSQLDHVTDERNRLVMDSDGLRASLNDMQSDSMRNVYEMGQRLKLIENEAEIARYEREKSFESNHFLKDEIQKLQEELQGRTSALASSESHRKELDMELHSLSRQREEDRTRSEALSNLAEEFKDHTRGVMEERNELYDEKIRVENERDEARTQLNEINRKLLDVEREVSSLGGERNEWKNTCDSLREQVREEKRRQATIATERDRLVHERAKEASVSERERALAMECEQKTKAVAVLHKKLTSAGSKIEKLTTQRGTFQRQRDDAGMRLRAAGAEFVTLNEKLKELTAARDDLQKQMVSLRTERDAVLSNVQTLSKLKPKLEVLTESIGAKEKDLEKTRQLLQVEERKNEKLTEESLLSQQKYTTLQERLKDFESQVEVITREKELLLSRIENFENEIKRLTNELKQGKNDWSSLETKLNESEAGRITERENADQDLTLIKAELGAEHKSRALLEEKMITMEKVSIGRQTMQEEVRRILVSSMSSAQNSTSIFSLIENDVVDFSETLDILSSSEDANVVAQSVMKFCAAAQVVFVEFGRCYSALQESNTHYSQISARLLEADAEIQELRQQANGNSEIEAELKSLSQRAESGERESENQAHVISQLEEELQTASLTKVQQTHQLQTMQEEMRREVDESARQWASDRAVAEQNADAVMTKLQSIWGMLERAIGVEQAREIWDDADYNEDTNNTENIGLAALRATASVVAEVGRKRSEVSELGVKLRSSDAEVARLIDRAEIAESERDALRGTVNRVERKANSAHEDGVEEARVQFETVISKLEDELAEARDQVERISDRGIRSDNEASELRALCSKLTSQLSGRTNELDETEEKLTYVQDQVTTLEEDLQEAHRRLKQEEEQSAHTRQHDVDRLRIEVEERTRQLETIEIEVGQLRERCDAAEKKAAESELVAKTHRQAEENLQIAIEQLEAAQEGAVEQRTIELEKKLRETEKLYEEAREKEEAALVSKSQLNLRDDEIRELRGAIGRLADERVELKLELEENLSRLNHPDAGGQLVDRRVVRQLLVSYFRVGSVRRRDVLELMSRMLAFSEADNTAVGLRRRALMDRIGSLVQPPEMDDASLPPIGTVSDKWIEFLMKETEEGEEQAGRW